MRRGSRAEELAAREVHHRSGGSSSLYAYSFSTADSTARARERSVAEHGHDGLGTGGDRPAIAPSRKTARPPSLARGRDEVRSAAVPTRPDRAAPERSTPLQTRSPISSCGGPSSSTTVGASTAGRIKRPADGAGAAGSRGCGGLAPMLERASMVEVEQGSRAGWSSAPTDGVIVANMAPFVISSS
jgi:hypothetical protein